MIQLLAIKDRIKSIKSIHKVTKAMELVTKTNINNVRQNAAHTKDFGPIDEACSCRVCQKYTRSYIRHLLNSNEILGLKLDLRSRNLTDAGLEHLKGLGKLEQLWLGGTAVTDVGLAYLAGLASLQSVDLASTKVTDAGLVHLKGLDGLIELSLRQSEVTQAGYMDLRGALIRCQIAWERPGPVRVGKRAPKFGIEELLQVCPLITMQNPWRNH